MGNTAQKPPTRVYLPHVPTRWDPVTRSRVPTLDLSPATRFGSFVSLTQPEDRTDSVHMSRLIDELRDAIQDIQPDDYILAVGDPILIAAAIAYACDCHGSARVLRWDRRVHAYEVVEVVL